MRARGGRLWIPALWLAALGALMAGSLLPGLAPPGFHAVDKILHGAAYMALAFVPAALLPRARTSLLAGILLGTVGYGIEIAQAHIPGRTASEADMLSNLIGILLGLGLGLAVRWRWRRRGPTAGLRPTH